MSHSLIKYSFEAEEEGPHLLLLGGIHGDEKCGSVALSRLIYELEAEILQIKKGILTILPICNPTAYAKNARYIEKNLNRIIGTIDDIEADGLCDEEYHAYDVQDAILEADLVLDLHSMPCGETPFVFQDYVDEITQAMAVATGLDVIVEDWPGMLERSGIDDLQDTPLFCYQNDIPSILIECGGNEDPEAVKVAYLSARRLLSFLDMVEWGEDLPFDAEEPKLKRKLLIAHTVIRKEQEGEFVKQWTNFSDISKDDVIARYDNGTELKSPIDGVLMLPMPEAKIGEEWFYIAEQGAS